MHLKQLDQRHLVGGYKEPTWALSTLGTLLQKAVVSTGGKINEYDFISFACNQTYALFIR